MQNAGSLVVLGSINADHILNLQSFPTPGETVTGNHYQVAFGGKGANQRDNCPTNVDRHIPAAPPESAFVARVPVGQ